MKDQFIEELFHAHQQSKTCPPPHLVIGFFQKLLGLLYPEFSTEDFSSVEEIKVFQSGLKSDLAYLLEKGKSCSGRSHDALVDEFFEAVPSIKQELYKDIEAMYQGDPAAKSITEVVRTYPGFYAIAAHRVAHLLHKEGVMLIPRIISEHAHSKTGIDIHPSAQIGSYFCIDHGTGIVIGETTQIGNHVKLYQGVTLGALSVNKADASKKRHPTIEDGVIIYAGATILGGKTTIGANSVIGGNVWLTQSVPANSKIYYKAKMTNSVGESDTITFKP